jgi:chromosome partitioning protein
MPAGASIPAFQATVGEFKEMPGAVAKVIAFAGQKGGTGKSLFAQAFMVEAARDTQSAVLVDLDIDQQTSFEWAQARLLNKYRPKIYAALIDPSIHPDFGLGAARIGFKVLIVDAPGWSDERTLRLAAIADLLVLPATPTVADLRPTIRLVHELKGRGIAGNKVAIAFNHVRAASELSFARRYLKDAGLVALPGFVRELLGYRSLQNSGRGITEAAAATLKKEAKETMALIDKLLQKTASPQMEERFKLSEERFRLTESEEVHERRKRRRR